MKLQRKKAIAAGMAIALCVSALSVPQMAAATTAVKKVTLNKSKATLYKGADSSISSVTLKATVKPASAGSVKWTTSAKKVATVSAKGVVKAQKAGSAVITAQAGSKKATCKITVKKVAKKVKKITLSPKPISLKKGSTAKISVSISPAKATIKDVTFKSGNTKVATVTSAGKVKGVKAGTAKITVSAIDGSKVKATVTVKVTTGSTDTGTEPSADPSTDPSTDPDTEPSEEPSVTPSTEPSVEPTATPILPAEPTPTPVPEEYSTEVEADEDGGYTLSDSVDYKITDGDSSVLVDQGTIANCSSAISQLNIGIDIADMWDSYASKLSDPGEFSTTKDGVKVVLAKADGKVTATVSVSGQNALVDSTYTVTKGETAFLMSGGMFASASVTQSGAAYGISGITWASGAPSILTMLGSSVSVDASTGTVSGNGMSAVFSGGTVKITGLPEKMKIYSK